ncbi:hypothetical protein KC968_01170 [Candidatus Saccharibacteria bacterium]|nr:hypothetical protein [Candidatus Saccharibacteria bacterium]
MPKKQSKITQNELDTVYFLKLVVYMILGSLWLKFTDGSSVQMPLPLGFMAGLILASHDKIQLDRKIGFAVLLVAMLVGFWMPFGIFIVF